MWTFVLIVDSEAKVESKNISQRHHRGDSEGSKSFLFQVVCHFLPSVASKQRFLSLIVTTDFTRFVLRRNN